MPRLPTLRVLGALLAFTGATPWTACSDAEPPDAPPDAYSIPLRTEAELREVIDAACRAATQDERRPVLVEFSAEWCGDCRKLAGMKREPVLAAEIARWAHVDVNVERFDRHRALLDALDVESIAHWSILAPTDCREPIERWPRLAARTLEVSSGAARNLTAEDLAGWLARLRTRPQDPTAAGS